jgi:hypothetical protein
MEKYDFVFSVDVQSALDLMNQKKNTNHAHLFIQHAKDVAWSLSQHSSITYASIFNHMIKHCLLPEAMKHVLDLNKLQVYLNMYLSHPIYERCIRAYIEAYCMKNNLTIQLNDESQSQIEICNPKETKSYSNPLSSKVSFQKFINDMATHFF